MRELKLKLDRKPPEIIYMANKICGPNLEQFTLYEAGLGGSVGCAVRLETKRSRVHPRRGRQHSFVETDHEIFSTVILSLPLIQEGQFVSFWSTLYEAGLDAQLDAPSDCTQLED